MLRRTLVRFATATSLAVGIAAAACAPAVVVPADPPAAEITPEFVILSADEIAALADLLRMEDRRELDARVHAFHSTNPNPLVRSRAALAAGRIGGEGAAAAILPFLADTAESVRADAAFALGLVADTARVVVEALERIATDSVVGTDAIEAIHALARTGGDRAAAVIFALLAPDVGAPGTPVPTAPAAATAAADSARHAGRSARRAAEASLAVWRLPRSDAAVDRVVELAYSMADDARWTAAYALMRWAPPRAAPALRGMLDDDSPLVRSLAARALRAAVADSAGIRADALAALVVAAADSTPHVRISAARSLGTFQEATAILPLARMLADPDSNVVLAAVEALAASGPTATTELRAIAGNDAARTTFRATALAALVRHDYRSAEPILAEWQRSADWLRRLAVARSLAPLEWGTVAARLGELARDPDTRVAAAALSAIATSAPAGAALALQTEALASPAVAVRAAAIRGIGRHATAADLAILLEAYAATSDDAESDAAIAAINALAELAERGVPVQRAFNARFAAPANPVVRRHAIARLAPSGWQWRPIDTGRADDWYRRIVSTYIAAPLAGEPLPRAIIDGPSGPIVLELDGFAAPMTVDNFITLAERGFFDDRRDSPPRWHRVVPNFVLQDGDPFGDGSGGPGYSIRDELNRLRYGRGVLGMALSGPDTGGSQWFITHSPQPHLDAGYTAFGRVVEGMENADRVLQDDPIHSVRIERGTPVGGS